MFYSPLRYPGGKGKLTSFMEFMIDRLGHRGGTYIEPFAGGAGIAIELLERQVVDQIVINDLDKGVYSFWRAILEETDRFIDQIRTVPLDMAEWNRQHDICHNNNRRYSFELGFATFYMNRTNRSGIIKGGVIGGSNQTGNYLIDARFNREDLTERIKRIAALKSKIHLYNKDVVSFVTRFVPKYQENTLMFFDPPYYAKGKQLYLNFFKHEDHVKIEELIRTRVHCDWIITYDDAPEIVDIYDGYPLRHYDLSYSVANKRKAIELIIFCNEQIIPTNEEILENGIAINLR